MFPNGVDDWGGGSKGKRKRLLRVWAKRDRRKGFSLGGGVLGGFFGFGFGGGKKVPKKTHQNGKRWH